MTTKTKAPRTREEIRRSIRAFGRTMSGPPAAKAAPVVELDAETKRIWALIENA